MISSATEAGAARIVSATVSDEDLALELADGGTVTAPVAWYLRVLHARPAERANWRLIGQGEGIHWPDTDEDISADNILRGQRSAESASSLNKWLRRRQPPP